MIATVTAMMPILRRVAIAHNLMESGPSGADDWHRPLRCHPTICGVHNHQAPFTVGGSRG
jgi:hypothetical protein